MKSAFIVHLGHKPLNSCGFGDMPNNCSCQCENGYKPILPYIGLHAIAIARWHAITN